MALWQVKINPEQAKNRQSLAKVKWHYNFDESEVEISLTAQEM